MQDNGCRGYFALGVVAILIGIGILTYTLYVHIKHKDNTENYTTQYISLAGGVVTILIGIVVTFQSTSKMGCLNLMQMSQLMGTAAVISMSNSTS